MKNYIVVALFLSLTACGGGGGGSEDNEELPKTAISVERIAGPTPELIDTETNPQLGCIDGLASNVLLAAPLAIASSSDKKSIFIAEQGSCDANFRIRNIDLSNQTVRTIIIGAQLPTPTEPEPINLQKFIGISAIAQGQDGTLLIADSDVFTGGLTTNYRNRFGLGYGLWALSSTGELKKLAGFTQPARTTPKKDGVGADAVFGYITKACAGAQGEFYIRDSGVVRKVMIDGKVETLLDADGNNFTDLYCGQNGRNLVRLHQSKPESTYEVMDLISLRRYSGISDSILSLDGENHAWAFDSQSSNLKIIDLLNGKELPEATIPTSGGIRFKENSYGVSISTLSSAGVDSAYIRTAYGVLRLSYKN